MSLSAQTLSIGRTVASPTRALWLGANHDVQKTYREQGLRGLDSKMLAAAPQKLLQSAVISNQRKSDEKTITFMQRLRQVVVYNHNRFIPPFNLKMEQKSLCRFTAADGARLINQLLTKEQRAVLRESLFMRGEELIKNQAFERARLILKEAWQVSSELDDISAFKTGHRYSQCLLKLGQFKEAVEILDKLVQKAKPEQLSATQLAALHSDLAAGKILLALKLAGDRNNFDSYWLLYREAWKLELTALSLYASEKGNSISDALLKIFFESKIDRAYLVLGVYLYNNKDQSGSHSINFAMPNASFTPVALWRYLQESI